MHPFQCCDLVEHGPVARPDRRVPGVELPGGEKAESAEPVVDADDDASGTGGKCLAAVNYPGSLSETATMHPHDHRQFR